jgi:hypothetical protein
MTLCCTIFSPSHHQTLKNYKAMQKSNEHIPHANTDRDKTKAKTHVGHVAISHIPLVFTETYTPRTTETYDTYVHTHVYHNAEKLKEHTTHNTKHHRNALWYIYICCTGWVYKQNI